MGAKTSREDISGWMRCGTRVRYLMSDRMSRYAVRRYAVGQKPRVSENPWHFSTWCCQIRSSTKVASIRATINCSAVYFLSKISSTLQQSSKVRCEVNEKDI